MRHSAPRRRWRRSSRLALTTLALALVAAASYAVVRHVGAGSPSGASGTTTTLAPGAAASTTAPSPTSLFYLAVGASASLGVQPTGIPAHNGHFTAQGYANDFVSLEAARGVTVTLHKVGCMGETAESMVGAGDHCHTLPATQLSAAVAYLRAHQGDPGVVSVDIGFNDIRPCMWVVPLATSCAQKGIAAVQKDEPTILNDLKSAAGPRVQIVGLLYADPFLYRYLKPAPGPDRATESLTYFNQLDAVLRAAYQSAGVDEADVYTAFKSNVTTPTTLAGHGTVPTNVALVCELTWMCAKYPWGPDDHPNKTGYTVIARAILAALPSSW